MKKIILTLFLLFFIISQGKSQIDTLFDNIPNRTKELVHNDKGEVINSTFNSVRKDYKYKKSLIEDSDSNKLSFKLENLDDPFQQHLKRFETTIDDLVEKTTNNERELVILRVTFFKKLQQEIALRDRDILKDQIGIIESEKKKIINEKYNEYVKKIENLYIKFLDDHYDRYLTEKSFRWFHVNDKYKGFLFYNQHSLKSFQNTRLSGALDNAVFETEFASGFAGPLRVSLGTRLNSFERETIDSAQIQGLTQEAISIKIDSVNKINQEKTNLAALVSGGGLVNLKIEYPILKFTGGISAKGDIILFTQTNFFSPSINQEISFSEANFHQSLGLDIKLNYKLVSFNENDETNLETFVEYRPKFTLLSDGYKRELEINNSIFFMGDLFAGFKIDRFIIYASYQHFTDDNLKNKGVGRIGLGYVTSL